MSLIEENIRRIHQRVGTVVLSKYRLERLLGIGGMAAVFEATHRNGNRVALKLLHPELAHIAEVRTRFLREGYVANRIEHPGVVRIVDDDDDEAEQAVVLVCEVGEGETLEARWERFGGRLPLTESLHHADRVLDVLAAAHDQGIVHRDIKPDNLFLTVHGELKVLDFGIARLLDGTGATRSGQLLGTPAFMAPEQANGQTRDVGARSDLWSLGAVLFTLLTGAHVHPAASSAVQMIYAATQVARPVELVASWLPSDVASLVNRALAFDRDARWPDARSMQTALRDTKNFRGSRASQPGPPLARPPKAPNDTIAEDRRPPTKMPDPGLTTELSPSPAAAAAATPTVVFDRQGRAGPSGRNDPE
jgi:serine/threonine-protein kinase